MVVLPPPFLPMPQNPTPYTYTACPLPLGLIIMQINCLDRAVGFSFLDFFYSAFDELIEMHKMFSVLKRGPDEQNYTGPRRDCRLNMIITVPPHRNYQAMWGGALSETFTLRWFFFLDRRKKMSGWPKNLVIELGNFVFYKCYHKYSILLITAHNSPTKPKRLGDLEENRQRNRQRFQCYSSLFEFDFDSVSSRLINIFNLFLIYS